jgi:antitoxin component YwqK of YwqJK toxin-antitoxin module
MIGLRLLLISFSLWLSGCGFAHVNADDERRPDTVVGVGAKVMYPGQPGPGITGPPAAPAPTQGAQGAPQPDPTSSGSVTMMGGTSQDGSQSIRERNSPLGPLTTLFGYPFWIFGKSLKEKAEAQSGTTTGPGGGSAGSSGTQPATPDQLEKNRLEQENARMREMLEHRAPSTSGASSVPSISEELASLRSTVARHAESRAARGGSVERAREALDRDGDGRTDFWLYAGPGNRKREVFDDNGDGEPDRIQIYAEDGTLARVEEDSDGDGERELVSLYSEGQLTRKRADTNRDGEPDAWSFYRDGNLLRHEVDRNGDGFRDITLHYEADVLVREEQDQDGDGRADVVIRYSEGEISRREEDVDRDGTPDVISFYERGKLVRKEVRSEDLLEAPRPGGS